MFGDGAKLNLTTNNITSLHHKKDEVLLWNQWVETTTTIDQINREKYAIPLIDAITTWPYKN